MVGRSQGVVEIFATSSSTNNTNTWSQIQSLSIYNMDTYSCFGSTLAMYNDTLAVGSYCHSNYQGAVFIYTWVEDGDKSQWVLATTLKGAASNEYNTFFGYSLALTSESILISAYGQGMPYPSPPQPSPSLPFLCPSLCF